MNDVDSLTATAVDAIFSLEGLSLPHDHAQALQLALCAALPWLQTDAIAAVLPLKLAPGDPDQGLLSKRTQLILRVAAHRMNELRALAGAELLVAGCRLRLDDPHPRALRPMATLYAYKVAADNDDEFSFMQDMEKELTELAIGGERVCGKRGQMVLSGRVQSTFSLMLHGLRPEQSLRLQHFGLGPHRLLGCGVFVPHKSATAV
ncbi:type I-MYXAN CRISPR-associated protein Cas6/Cmx6 [Rhodoferax sp.]|uniref:type I-MYXAN CRISPR-associated protein Cas6/Cmx6 n=1 Tax=Rhodoferax sp. TaxID=50421 RepID=UPI0028468749|nr:type I-MYXAN CRISPR-associated protein Cas6/Cmx6 [Rhodoferax sp.]MDR3370514.1 type I-MYXAN CRISPR-associated protein Cas6/Cmx6 [Rhodoferax sp.]